MKSRTKLVESIESIVSETFQGTREIKVFGSSATGLLLPGSDIDIVCLLTDSESLRLSENPTKHDTDIKKLSPMKEVREIVHCEVSA